MAKKSKTKMVAPVAEIAPGAPGAVAEFATKVGISMKVERVESNPNWTFRSEATHWLARFTLGTRKLAVYYSLLPAHEDREPTLDEVLCCTALDAYTVESTPYDTWLLECGSGMEATRARDCYKAMEKGRDLLKKFSKDHFTDLLHIARGS